MKTQIRRNDELYELTPEIEAELLDSKHYNPDLAPTKVSDRTWRTKDIADFWLGLSVSIPALALASSLVALGVSPVLAVINVILGNVIVLIPIQLNSHVGTKYGIPYPIFARMTFGNKGAKLSTISRSIIGCGWTSIQSWVGGGALAALIGIVIPFFSDQSQTISMPGNDNVMVGQLIGFAVFVLVCGWVAYNGMEKIKWVQNISAPLLIVVITGLIIWSIYTIYATGHSFMDVFRVGNNEALIEQNGGFAYVYLAGLTANIAYWATMALNIPDFSKMAKSQKDQFNGQLIGMPIPMAVCAIAGALFAQATTYAYGTASYDPTTVFFYMSNPLAVAVCAIGVIVATLTTCVAANVVAPANGWSDLAPKKVSFKKGVIITIVISIFVMQLCLRFHLAEQLRHHYCPCGGDPVRGLFRLQAKACGCSQLVPRGQRPLRLFQRLELVCGDRLGGILYHSAAGQHGVPLSVRLWIDAELPANDRRERLSLLLLCGVCGVCRSDALQLLRRSSQQGLCL